MGRSVSITPAGWILSDPRPAGAATVADRLLQIVDAGLIGVICVAPFFFGGRHDLGRLMLVALIAVAAIAWFARQSLLAEARWPRTTAYAIFLFAAGLLMLQLVPLPSGVFAALSPHAANMLSLWNAGAESSMGTWTTLSLVPHETTKSLAMLASYGLLFAVVASRVQALDDASRLMKWVALSAAIMAGFGALHYFTTDGRFFWFFAHPFRSAQDKVSGAFLNRNHFASFLVLGMGPLVAWLLDAVSAPKTNATAKSKPGIALRLTLVWTLGGAVAVAVTAILLSCSRGGALAMLVAGVVLVSVYRAKRIVDSRFIYGLICLAVVVVGLLSIYGSDNVANRLDDFTEGSVEQLDQHGIRRMLWAANIQMFRDHWLTGTGAGSHREVYPVFFPEPHKVTFTHAENGYLQIASENGIGGSVLLAAGIALCICWAASCLRNAENTAIIRWAGAAMAGLAASLAHSCVDFVWYIPACMSVTVVLAACLLRLSQFAHPETVQEHTTRLLSRARWMELMVIAVLFGGWSFHAFVGPAMAAVHWDRYLRASVANSKLSRQHLTKLLGGTSAADLREYQSLNDTMIRHLEQAIAWDPRFADAHSRLAGRYLHRFELSQQNADNAMGLAQFRDAALASDFESVAQLNDWLNRAVGHNVMWLRLALLRAQDAVALSPLRGEDYVMLSELCFLNGAGITVADAYVAQSLRVRPKDAGVLYAVGDQRRRLGDIAGMIDYWNQCFGFAGRHQMRIIYWLAGRMPVDEFLSTFEPDWNTLRPVWTRYREIGQPEDADKILVYAATVTQRDTQHIRGSQAAQLWYMLSLLHTEVDQHAEALACLERAYAANSNNYAIRRALGVSLQKSGRLAEAENHFRWCLARRPADKYISTAIVKISKERLAQREPYKSSFGTFGRSAQKP